jgi:hypothetical protein
MTSIEPFVVTDKSNLGKSDISDIEMSSSYSFIPDKTPKSPISIVKIDKRSMTHWQSFATKYYIVLALIAALCNACHNFLFSKSVAE